MPCFFPVSFSERLLSHVADWTLVLELLFVAVFVFGFFSVSEELTLELSEEDRFCSDRLVFATVNS